MFGNAAVVWKSYHAVELDMYSENNIHIPFLVEVGMFLPGKTFVCQRSKEAYCSTLMCGLKGVGSSSEKWPCFL